MPNLAVIAVRLAYENQIPRYILHSFSWLSAAMLRERCAKVNRH
ncbi:hypothetical protein [Shimia sp. R10_1]|nr:hypothetical protein [Shimia sp. R10_1]